MNNVRDLLPIMGQIAGLTTANIQLANKLAKELDPQTFNALTTFVSQARAKTILLQKRGKRYGF